MVLVSPAAGSTGLAGGLLGQVRSRLDDTVLRHPDAGMPATTAPNAGIPATAERSPAPSDRAGSSPDAAPPTHDTNPQAQGTGAAVDITPENAVPLPGDAGGGGQDVVVGQARGEQSANGRYHGHVTIASLKPLGIGIAEVGVETSQGQTAAGPLDPLQQLLLNRLCASSGGNVCLTVLQSDSATNENGSSNTFSLAHADLLRPTGAGTSADAVSSHGDIAGDGTCQTSHGDSSAASANVAGLGVDALHSSSDSVACNDGSKRRSSTSSGIVVANTPLPARQPGSVATPSVLGSAVTGTTTAAEARAAAPPKGPKPRPCAHPPCNGGGGNGGSGRPGGPRGGNGRAGGGGNGGSSASGRGRGAGTRAAGPGAGAPTFSGAAQLGRAADVPSADPAFFGVNGQALTQYTWRSADPALLGRQVGSIADTLGPGGWVRVNVHWALVEPVRPLNGIHAYQFARIDAIVAALANRNLSASLLLVGAPTWAISPSNLACGSALAPPADLDSYAAMAGALAQRYGAGGSFWASHPELPYTPTRSFELWNEANWNGFWCPKPDPASYAELLDKGAAAVHAAAPSAQAIMGGLVVSTDGAGGRGMATKDFLSQVLAARPDLVSALDGIGVHLYTGSAAEDQQSLAWFRSVLEGVGLARKPIYVNEFGWPTQGGGYPTLSEADRATQVANLTNVLWRTDCNVAGVAIQAWNTAEADASNGEDWFGIADPQTGAPYPTAVAYAGEIATAEGRGTTAPPTATAYLCSPETFIDSWPTRPTSNPSPSFSFHSSKAGSDFECSLDQGTPDFAPCPGGSLQPPAPLADGSWTLRVRAVDAAGNVDPTPATRTFTIDTTAPETLIDSGVSGLTNKPRPTFSFHASESGSTLQCSLDQGTPAYSPCQSGALQPSAALADGSYTLRVRATDQAGNLDPTPATRSFTIDTTAPETLIDSGPEGPTQLARPSFSFHSSEPGSALQCSLDQGTPAYSPCQSGTFQPPAPLADGSYTLRVRATDPAGNLDPSPATRAFTVDVPPDTTIDSGPAGPTNDPSPSFAFHPPSPARTSSARSTRERRPSLPVPAARSSPPPPCRRHYTLRVRATDAAGTADPTPATRSFTVDTIQPETLIDSGVSGLTNKPRPTFSFHASESGSALQCSIDQGTPAYSACQSGSLQPSSPLADGFYTLRVRATDAAGNVDPTPAARTFTIDTTPPETLIDSGVAGRTQNTRPKFSFHASEPGSALQCSLDQGTPAYSPCQSGSLRPPAPLADGSYTLRVRATDRAGNVDPTPATRSFTIFSKRRKS